MIIWMLRLPLVIRCPKQSTLFACQLHSQEISDTRCSWRPRPRRPIHLEISNNCKYDSRSSSCDRGLFREAIYVDRSATVSFIGLCSAGVGQGRRSPRQRKLSTDTRYGLRALCVRRGDCSGVIYSEKVGDQPYYTHSTRECMSHS